LRFLVGVSSSSSPSPSAAAAFLPRFLGVAFVLGVAAASTV
jgi:hypothetical protein